MLDNLLVSANNTGAGLLQHLYGVVNGVFLTTTTFLLLTALSYGHGRHDKKITKSFLLLATGCALIGLHSLYFQNYSGAVSSRVIPSVLFDLSPFAAPLALAIITYIIIQVTSIKSYQSYKSSRQFKHLFSGLYLLDASCFIALFFMQNNDSIALMLILIFIPHSAIATLYCYHGLRDIPHGRFMGMLFSLTFITCIIFSYLIYSQHLGLSSSMLSYVHLAFAFINVIFCFIFIRYGYDEAKHFFTTLSQDPNNLSPRILEGLKNREFYLHYQPQIDLSTNSLCGLEALLRWKHPVHGEISPAKFIPLAEESGSIDELCKWVIRATVKQSGFFTAQGVDLKLSINFSAQNLNPEMIDFLGLALAEHSVPARNITVEITESLFLHETKEANEALAMLEKLGCDLSLDDYGTGFSSLSYINKLALKELKIDRSFISDMHDNKDNYVISNSTIRMSQSLGLNVVAEGIETEDVMIMLKTMGCNIAQGYFIAAPMPADELSFWLISTHYRIKKLKEEDNDQYSLLGAKTA